MDGHIKVTFQPSGRSVSVLPGTTLLEAAARAGDIVETPCGGAGRCGKCLVRIAAGNCPPTPDEQRVLAPGQLDAGYRLACRCRAQGRLVVEIPAASLFQAGQRILADHAGGPVDLQPAVSKRVLAVPPATAEHPLSDCERLAGPLGGLAVDLAVLRELPDLLRAGDGRITATIAEGRVVRVEAGDRTAPCLGLACDIGTTTLVAALVDLGTGGDLAVASAVNPQTSFGDDVVSRIRKCRDEHDGLRVLQAAILKAVHDLTADVCAQAGVHPEDIGEAVFAGNTTMQQILCGISPRALGEIPFAPAFRRALNLRAGDLGLPLLPAARIYVFPQIGGFVGGDTVAGVLATRLAAHDDPALLVDVGTNGEIVLAHRGTLTATSVAAGPAFEGARILHGMRATRGAIEKVVLDDGGVELNTIGDARPTGLCGTGLIDAAAELLRRGIVDATGRILDPDELPPSLPEALRRRIVRPDGQAGFVLAEAGASGTGEAVTLTQRDIRELQLANGAIRAGIGLLLRAAGLAPADLGWVLLAGGFGNFIRRSNALRIGMLPPLPRERIRFVGNTSLFGAKLALLSQAEKEAAARIVDAARHVDLSRDPEFQAEFGAAMLFPEEEAAP